MTIFDRIAAAYETPGALSPWAMALWLTLLHMGNREYWPEVLTARTGDLAKLANMSRRQLLRARAELIAAGLIGHEENGPLAGRYRLAGGQSTAPVRRSSENLLRLTGAVLSPTGAVETAPVPPYSSVVPDTKNNKTNGARARAYTREELTKLPVRATAQHRYTQRQYAPEELDALFFDPYKGQDNPHCAALAEFEKNTARLRENGV